MLKIKVEFEGDSPVLYSDCVACRASVILHEQHSADRSDRIRCTPS